MLAMAAVLSAGDPSPTVGDAAPPAPQKIEFRKDFAFGTATAAYQIEGGWNEGGRGLSIWDAFVRSPGKIRTGESGDVAADHYRRMTTDVRLMAQMRLRYYRFSISWSRVLPNGHGAVNEEGVKFYNALIDELFANGIRPVVTLYHWDLPLALQIEHDGWLSEATASAFVQYATLCFSRFGDRVKHWITFNEPQHHAVYGYARGEHAPGRTRRPKTEPYLAGHYMLLAHAHAVARFRADFQPRYGAGEKGLLSMALNSDLPYISLHPPYVQAGEKGLISMALNSDWREPASEHAADAHAAQRSMEFTLGWSA